MLTRNQFIEELVEFASSNSYNLNDIIVTHGGACLLMGLRETTGDIDVMVSIEIWHDQLRKGGVPVDLGKGIFLMSCTDNIDIHIGMSYDTLPDEYTTEGVRYHGLEQTLLDYKKLRRLKDVKVIRQIKELIRVRGVE